MTRLVSPRGREIMALSSKLAMTSLGLKLMLSEVLEGVEDCFAFACGSRTPWPPIPGLHIKDHGHVTMPITQADTLAMVTRSKKSAFGKGTKTMIDEAVRKTWELDSNQFSLDNPDWNSFVTSLLPRICSQFGINAVDSVRAELYKLLIYEAGAFFKPH